LLIEQYFFLLFPIVPIKLFLTLVTMLINIVTCAFNSSQFTEMHVRSIADQAGDLIHWVGVDGCSKTLSAFEANMHDRMRLFSIKKNKGKALMQNSLVSLIGEGQQILLFDSDDYLAKGSVKAFPVATGQEIYSLPMVNSDDPMKIKKAEAIMLMRSDTYFYMGGFRPEIACGHDTCFRQRYEKATGREVKFLRTLPAFIRNRHPQSLTRHPSTGMGSTYRRQVKTLVSEEIHKGNLLITYKIHERLTQHL